MRRVDSYDSSPIVTGTRPRRETADVDTLTDEQLAQKLRPIMLGADGVEYVLDADQALDAARRIKNMPKGEALSDDSAYGVRQTPTVAPSEDALNNGVFGGESRVNMNGSAQDYPWNMIAVNYSGCSLFKMINHYTAVTAAHCVYSSSGWRTRGNLQFAAGSATPRGQLPAHCYAITVPNGWSSDVGDDEYDYAIIRLREGGSSGAWCNYDDYNTGYFGYKGVGGCTTSVHGDMAGYPAKSGGSGAAPPGDWSYPTLFNDYRTDGWTSCVTYPNHLWYYNDNSGGQSGGPFWTNFSGSYKVRAVNSGIWTGAFDDSNYGRRIDDSVISFMNNYKGY